VVLKFGTADRYTIWSTDSSGNYLSNGAVLAGSDSALTTLEASFQQDLNGNGVVPGSTVTEALGSTQLTQIGSGYYLSSGGASIIIKYAGSPITQGQFGYWTLIGAEQTSSGYSVVMKYGTADRYTVWSIDSNGNYLSNSAVVAGSDTRVTSLESSFHQDLNNDGTISTSAATVAGSSATNAGQSTVALNSEKPAFDVVHFLGEPKADGWDFKSVFQSGGAGISAQEGFSLNGVGNQWLTELLNEAQASRQNTFATADGAHDALVNHDSSIQAKAFVVDLHTGFLIVH